MIQASEKGCNRNILLKVNVSFANLQLYIYIYIYIYTNLPVDVIIRLPHPRSGDS